MWTMQLRQFSREKNVQLFTLKPSMLQYNTLSKRVFFCYFGVFVVVKSKKKVKLIHATAKWSVRWTQDRTVRVRALAGVIAPRSTARHFTLVVPLSNLAPVVQRVDNAIQQISIGKTNYAIRWIVLSTL